jgi:hypothetical protein
MPITIRSSISPIKSIISSKCPRTIKYFIMLISCGSITSKCFCPSLSICIMPSLIECFNNISCQFDSTSIIMPSISIQLYRRSIKSNSCHLTMSITGYNCLIKFHYISLINNSMSKCISSSCCSMPSLMFS